MKKKKLQSKQYSLFSIKPSYLENYVMYLKTKPDEKLLKWAILDDSIKKVLPKLMDYYLAHRNQYLYQIFNFGRNKQFERKQKYTFKLKFFVFIFCLQIKIIIFLKNISF
ncbi:unnamed protein product [Paramecium sonneborni]|uniref:Uncharacterized protein n=1 Tax=Paramecium sonneborni TaxID=65129 RepID=A0A8S1RRJ8_9CILI|nr:unnamed protein product [Paramecium sonneborni]